MSSSIGLWARAGFAGILQSLLHLERVSTRSAFAKMRDSPTISVPYDPTSKPAASRPYHRGGEAVAFFAEVLFTGFGA
ncbi:hypothetical protein, partial [Bradyrhizobium sp.]|uniref:hypothetical protein n=1 Tax=Bradyrhizobium sp. TaxID=376 RepID=UPI003D147B7A